MFFYSLASGHLISSALKVISFKHGSLFRAGLDFRLRSAVKQNNLMLYIYPCTSTYPFCTNIFKSSNACLTLFIVLKCFILWGMHAYV